MKRLPVARLLIAGFLVVTCATASSRVIQVGPNELIKTVAEAARVAHDDDVVEIATGEYLGDVTTWTQKRMTIRGVGERPILNAAGRSAEGKAIWVIRDGDFTIVNIEFRGAQVPDKNGAGIRLEKGQLVIRNCSFVNNQNGILTSDNPESRLIVIDSEFGHNGYGDGQSHNLYVGDIARLTVTGSYFHHANVGHLIKSRAAVNDIRYNRLTDEIGGRASYELEFANGGIAYVIGNIIQQGSQTENPHIISYGAEGYKWPKNELYLVNNTLVDNRPKGGVFLRIKPGPVVVKAINNLLVGLGKLETASPGDYRNNFNVDWDQFEFAAREDYRLKKNSTLRGLAIDAGKIDGRSLMPDHEYVHPRQTILLNGLARNPGALQSVK